MIEHFQSPFQEIWVKSLNGGNLILRLRDNKEGWLRVHDNGDLEVALGGPRRDEARSPTRSLQPGDPLLLRALALHGELRQNFQSGSLLERSPWDHFYPVQAFSGPESPVIEGYVGIEIDMGATTDVFGFRNETHARASLRTLQDLLGLLQR